MFMHPIKNLMKSSFMNLYMKILALTNQTNFDIRYLKQKEEVKMKRYVSKYFPLFISVGLVIAFMIVFGGVSGAQDLPGLPKLPGGLNIPSLSGAKTGFAGLDALNTAKELYGQKDNKTSYPTPNIAVSGNHIVIAWPNGVVTVETIADDGTLKRTVLGPPSENNIPSAKK
jgi:hypothetical protein